MLLIGMFDSPYVRRVAITLKLLEMPFDHGNWSVGTDFDRIREYSPLGRVPVLVMDDGAALVESGAILDAIDDRVGPGRALLPATGVLRREAGACQDSCRLSQVWSGQANLVCYSQSCPLSTSSEIARSEGVTQ